MIIQSKRVYIAGEYYPLQLELGDGFIQAVYPYGQKETDLDFGEDKILPGFIDIHTHGGYGFDITHPKQAAFDLWREKLPEEGVTSFLAATLSDTSESLDNQLSFLSKQKEKREQAAMLLGIHLEGPFISARYKGAQPKKSLRLPDLKLFRHWQKESHERIKIVTIAPELSGALDLIRVLSGEGVIFSLGHSGADYDQAMLAIANGAKSSTHTFNAMGFHHRNALLANAVLSIPGLYAELICDGLHAHKSAIQTFFALKGRDHSILVSDSLMLKGEKSGSIGNFSGQKITLSDSGRILLEDGTLAGSSLKLNEALRYLIRECGIREGEAVNALTSNPAALLSLDGKGLIQAGKEADLAVLNSNYDVCAVFLQGKPLLFKKEPDKIEGEGGRKNEREIEAESQKQA